jgi:hypothetical protein
MCAPWPLPYRPADLDLSIRHKIDEPIVGLVHEVLLFGT